MKHVEDIIRVKFEETNYLPYSDDNVLYFNNFESVINWMKVQFRENEIERIEIDIIEVVSCEE